eukprot:scaffold2927_cov143-Cylindrotheca_fusiformis.AAC.4
MKKLHVLVIAHPDDESMFFLPTIQSLLSEGETLWCLCLTTGNYDGLGKQRTKELTSVCKVLGISKVLIQNDLQDHPTQRWEIPNVSAAIQEALWKNEKEDLRSFDKIVLLTFDSMGVSGHVNHIDTHWGVCEFVVASNSMKPPPIQEVEAWELETEQNLLAKYIPVGSWFLLLISLVLQNSYHSNGMVNSDGETRIYRWHEPKLNWKAMATHESQFVWYRRLFVVFSCYTYVNKLHRIQVKQSTTHH